VAVETKRPEWIKVRLPGGENYTDIARIMRTQQMHTVWRRRAAQHREDGAGVPRRF
jgi:lipoate synthase